MWTQPIRINAYTVKAEMLWVLNFDCCSQKIGPLGATIVLLFLTVYLIRIIFVMLTGL